MVQLDPTDQERLEFYCAITSWGYGDVDAAIRWLNEPDADFRDFAEYLETFAREADTPMAEFDICALALEFICGIANAPELAGHVYGNFMCSDFDIEADKAAPILRKVKKDDRIAAWYFLADRIGVTYKKA